MSFWDELGEILDKAELPSKDKVEEGEPTYLENALMGKFGLSLSEIRLARRITQTSLSLRPHYEHKSALLWVLRMTTGMPPEMIEASQLLQVFCLGMAYELVLMEGMR